MAQTDSTDIASMGRRIIRAMLVITFYWVFLKLGGFLMNVLVVNYFGKGSLYDAFTATYNNLIYLLVFSSALKVLMPAFMPLFAQRMDREGEASAWELANTVTNLLLLTTATIAILGCVFTPQIVTTLLPGFTGETRSAAIRLLRWMLPGTLVLCFAIMAQGILNTYKVFSYPSAADAAQKLTWVAVLFVLLMLFRPDRSSTISRDIIGAAFLIGCVVQVAVLLRGLGGRLRYYRPRLPALSWRRLLKECLWAGGTLLLLAACVWGLQNSTSLSSEDRNYWTLTSFLVAGCLYAGSVWCRGRSGSGIVARFAFLAAPLLTGVCVGRYRDLVSSFFQSYTAEGAYGLIELGKKVINLPSVLISYSLAVAMLPYLCDIAARKDIAGIGRLAGRALRMISLFFLPLTVLTITLSEPIMQLLGDRGNWSPQDVRIAGLALAIPAAAIFFLAVESVLTQTFFSLQRTILPTAAGILFSLLHGFGLYVAITQLGFDTPDQKFLAVCIAMPLSRGLKNVLLFFFLQRRVHMFTLSKGLGFALKLALVSGIVGVTSRLVHQPLTHVLRESAFADRLMMFKLVKCVHLALPALAALAVFLGLCIALRIEEFGIALHWVRSRGWRKSSAQNNNTSSDTQRGNQPTRTQGP